MFKITVCVLCTLICTLGRAQENDDLVTVAVLFRHGDRAPISMYPTDPYNETYWPLGLGHLTERGEQQQTELGEWFRKRYDGFLAGNYNESELLVHSSNVNRTIMSARFNLAGLYPNESISTVDSIPITIPNNSILTPEDVCVNLLLRLADILVNDSYYQEVQKNNSELYKLVAEKTGTLDLGLMEASQIRDILYVESQHNLTLPDWTRGVYPEQLVPISEAEFKLFGYTPEIQQLMSGSLLNDIITNFKDVIAGKQTTKFFMYSAHDTNLASVLSVFGVPPGIPYYANTIILELHNGNEGPYVKIFYKDHDDLSEISLEGCADDCLLEDFQGGLQTVLIDYIGWLEKCFLP